MKAVCISDTHCNEYELTLPKGDLLIHTGDFDIRDLKRLEYINSWLGKQNQFKYRCIIMGNHDLYAQQLSKESLQTIFTNAIYLENSSVTINRIKIWGSPYTPSFMAWAYMLQRDELKKIWATIPNDTDIIINHGQPLGINDYVEIGYVHNEGCPHLRDKIKEIKPKYYIGGHLHGSYGIYQDEHTTYVNASLMDEGYNLINKPIILDI